MATIKPLLAKILIQVGADEPKEIGTIEIPINVSIPGPSVIHRYDTTINVSTQTPEVIAAEVAKRFKPQP
ncbi:hypothetical protein NIBR502772_05985 [Pseudarthrobacter sp. NIBRBAC000502772]|uniref:hypothetical protein n=1 Tax=Pseudarthrobacter sp. NIBRBAC000502772 TaxID=2590775 RepID=UPI001130F5A4|nr:hypothetical protein [Pseudarthrobacter sp. NIBRBAC000502772]QDG65824.1 hypothetical protein NIBR502772_05985 [Pseudarthrobacter sp. NIBRBAC000502772]